MEVSRWNNIPLGSTVGQMREGHGVTGDEVRSSQADIVRRTVRVVTQEDM